MKKMRVAIIGQGRSGRDIHGKHFLSENNDNAEVVAVVDALEDRRERAKKDFGCDAYADYRELFDRKDIDLIVNASFSHQHFAIAKDCLEHGYNVLNEKPFAKTSYEAMELTRIAKEKGVIVTAFHQSLYAPPVLKMKEVLTSGKIGEVMQINLCYSGFSRRWDWQTLQCFCAGGVYNTAPHAIGVGLDLIGWDPAAKVTYSYLGKTAFNSGDANDFAKIIITAPGKPTIDIECNNNDAYKPEPFKIFGTKGTIATGPFANSVKVKYIIPEELEARPVIMEPLRQPETGYPAYCGEKLNFHEEELTAEGDVFSTGSSIFYHMLYDAIMLGKPLDITPEKAGKVIEIIEAVHVQNPLPVLYGLPESKV
ncbi:MAG: Gfo/Idh/MocA family oxidoreductase [Clostridia bacterium]|nr:Gfo/Idh/MocA family oxidoreductase [Clostridia bacterium]